MARSKQQLLVFKRSQSPTPPTLQPLPLLVLLLAAAAALRAADAAPARAQLDNPLPCQCSDVDLRKEFILPAEFTCWQQGVEFQQCNADFMRQTILEIPEGYCQITCGRCDCCPSLLNATAAAGAAEFAWALDATGAGGGTNFSEPGAMATLLAPDDNAMRDLLGRLGGKARVQSDPATRDRLRAVLDLHVLPPLAESRAVWSAPFLVPGARLPSAASPDALVVGGSGGGGGGGGEIAIVSPGSTAKVRARDVYACKGFVQVLDWYLLPEGGVGGVGGK